MSQKRTTPDELGIQAKMRRDIPSAADARLFRKKEQLEQARPAIPLLQRPKLGEGEMGLALCACDRAMPVRTEREVTLPEKSSRGQLGIHWQRGSA